MSDWWAERLAGRQVAPQAPQAWSQQPQQYQAPPQQQEGGLQWPQWQQQQPQQQAPRVTMHNLIEAMASWKGGPGARNSARCPECGSPNFFSRGAEVAPQCYDCGANPRFAPQGQPRS